jgi:hypothetical protein
MRRTPVLVREILVREILGRKIRGGDQLQEPIAKVGQVFPAIEVVKDL